jgi:hypothetical protein
MDLMQTIHTEQINKASNGLDNHQSRKLNLKMTTIDHVAAMTTACDAAL